MKILVTFESFFGNTEKIARKIAEALGAFPQVRLIRVDEIKPEDLSGIDLLVVGSPTRGFRPSPDTMLFINYLKKKGLKHFKVASFDTLIDLDVLKSPFLKFIVRMGGYAAKPIAKKLTQKGGN